MTSAACCLSKSLKSSLCLREITEVFPDLAHVHLEPPVAPLHNEVGVDLDREVTIVNLQDLKVVQPNLDLVQERLLGN